MGAYSNGGKSKGRKEWWTPRWFVDQLAERIGTPCALDLAASQASTIAPRWLGQGSGIAENALAVNWYDAFERVGCESVDPWAFCNPPWDRIPEFLGKAPELAERGVPVVFLLPAKFCDGWGKIAARAAKIEMIAPRLNYYDPVLGMIRIGIANGSMLLTFRGQDTSQSFCVSEYRKPRGAAR